MYETQHELFVVSTLYSVFQQMISRKEDRVFTYNKLLEILDTYEGRLSEGERKVAKQAVRTMKRRHCFSEVKLVMGSFLKKKDTLTTQAYIQYSYDRLFSEIQSTIYCHLYHYERKRLSDIQVLACVRLAIHNYNKRMTKLTENKKCEMKARREQQNNLYWL